MHFPFRSRVSSRFLLRACLSLTWALLLSPLPCWSLVPPPLPPSWSYAHSNYIYTPESSPVAVVHFLGGAVTGSNPLFYRNFLEKVSRKGPFLIVATPHTLSLDHLSTCDDILSSFGNVAPEILKKYGPLPIYGMGHSLGGKLQVIISTCFKDTPRAGNVLVAFSDTDFTDDNEGMYKSLVLPISNAITPIASPLLSVLSTFTSLSLDAHSAFVGALGEYVNSSTPDATEVFNKMTDSYYDPDLDESNMSPSQRAVRRHHAANFEAAKRHHKANEEATKRHKSALAKLYARSLQYPSFLREVTSQLTQIPNSASSITAGAKVTPTATAVKNCVTKGYTVRRTLIVKFKDDTLHVPAISRWVGESVKKYQGERGMEWDEIERSGGHFQLVFDEEVAEGVGEWIRG